MLGENRRKQNSPPLPELSVKAERVSPLSLFEWFEKAFFGQCGWQRGSNSRPSFDGIGGFFIAKKLQSITKILF